MGPNVLRDLTWDPDEAGGTGLLVGTGKESSETRLARTALRSAALRTIAIQWAKTSSMLLGSRPASDAAPAMICDPWGCSPTRGCRAPVRPDLAHPAHRARRKMGPQTFPLPIFALPSILSQKVGDRRAAISCGRGIAGGCQWRRVRCVSPLGHRRSLAVFGVVAGPSAQRLACVRRAGSDRDCYAGEGARASIIVGDLDIPDLWRAAAVAASADGTNASLADRTDEAGAVR